MTGRETKPRLKLGEAEKLVEIPPRVEPEGPREHVVNALTSLSYFRDAHGGDWYAVLNGPVKIAELAGLLEGVEARLRFATGL